MGVGKLTVHYPDEEAIPFIAIGSDMFISHRQGTIIHFVRDGKGKVNNLLQGGNPFQRVDNG
jgi:hypothetical protein